MSKNKEVQNIATRGPLTPDHVIRTKRIPMVGRNVELYKNEYYSYKYRHNYSQKDILLEN